MTNNEHTVYSVSSDILIAEDYNLGLLNQELHDSLSVNKEVLIIEDYKNQAIDNGCYCIDAITQQEELNKKNHNDVKDVIAEVLNINLHKNKVHFMPKPGMIPYYSGDFKRTWYRPELYELLKNINYNLDWCDDEDIAEYIYNKYMYYDPVFWGTVNDIDGMTRTAYLMQDKANRISDYYNHLNALREIVLDSGIEEGSSYNPIHNYSRHEVHSGTDTTTQNGDISTENDGNYWEYPMQSSDRKAISDTHNEGNTSYEDLKSEFAHGHTVDVNGNIGVTTTAQMLSGEIDIMKQLLKIVDMYTDEFREFFWLNM